MRRLPSASGSADPLGAKVSILSSRILSSARPSPSSAPQKPSCHGEARLRTPCGCERPGIDEDPSPIGEETIPVERGAEADPIAAVTVEVGYGVQNITMEYLNELGGEDLALATVQPTVSLPPEIK